VTVANPPVAADAEGSPIGVKVSLTAGRAARAK